MSDYGRTTKKNAALRAIPIKICGVYKITNEKSGKFYIGSAINVRRRLRHHLIMLRKNEHNSPHLQNAFSLDGEENFSFLLLETCEKDDRLKREQFYLDALKPWEKETGYNISPRADSGPRLVYTDEMRSEISRRFKGKPKSAEHRKKISESQKVRKCTPEMRVRISQKLRAFFSDPANRDAQSKRQTGLTRRGTKWSEERKLSVSLKKSGIPQLNRRKYSDDQIDGWIKKRESGMTFFQISLEEKIAPETLKVCIKRRKTEANA